MDNEIEKETSKEAIEKETSKEAFNIIMVLPHNVIPRDSGTQELGRSNVKA